MKRTRRTLLQSFLFIALSSAALADDSAALMPSQESSSPDPIDAQSAGAALGSPGYGSLTLGYDSRYVLYGYRLTRHLYKADMYLSKPLTDKLSVWAGSWYGYLADDTYSELDLYGGANWKVTDRLTAGACYSLFNYFKAPFTEEANDQEYAVSLVRAVGEKLTLALRDQYDLAAKGHLLRALADFNQPLAGKLTLTLSAEYGYVLNYYEEEDGPHHALFKMSLAHPITDTLSATLFLARTLALDAIDSFEEDDTYGGVSMTWSF